MDENVPNWLSERLYICGLVIYHLKKKMAYNAVEEVLMEFKSVSFEYIDGQGAYYVFRDKCGRVSGAFFEQDLSMEWQQLAFLLHCLSKNVDFDCLEWYFGQSVKVFGLDRKQLLDLDCKLLNFQFGKRIPLERQLQIVTEE